MKAQTSMYEALTHVAWAYLLLFLNFNLGTLNLLPNWLGYLLILSALDPLGTQAPSAPLLAPLGKVLAGWDGFVWVMALFGRDALSLYPLDLIVGILGLYFHFQLLTNLAEIAQAHPSTPEQETHPSPATSAANPKPLSLRLLRLRTARTLLSTCTALPLPGGVKEAPLVAYPLLGVSLVVALLLVLALFELRRAFGPQDALS